MRAKRTFLRGVCAAALVAAGLSVALAQMPQVVAPVSATPTPGPLPEVLQKYSAVTAERLKKPEDGNWFHFRRTYDGWGFSPLNEITPKTVGRLQLVWSMATGQVEGHQAPPIVNNGVMFVATPGNQLLAIEAKTGNLLWRYKRRLPEDVVHLHPTNRGVALYGDKVYFASADCILVALDARTGKEVWTADVDDYRKAHYMSLAPLIVDGKVILGASGGELGVRGFVAAVDAETGKQLWKTYTIPGPGEPGSETWPAGGDHYKRGGGAVWITGTYDPETNLTFWGTGNAAPWFGDQRPGDNLYTSSVIALDVNTGEMKGHFQYHPNDSWDWDEVSPPIVVDYKRGGKTVKGLVNVSRSGYIWDLERTGGKINFVAGRPYVRQNVFKSLDPKTGRPDVDAARKPGTGKAADFCPSLWGGKDWPPTAFSPKTRMIYIPANDNLCHELVGETPKYVVGERYMGVAKNVMKIVEGADHIGELQAWNVDTGKKMWTTNLPSFNWGPVL
ncbi:MAG: PQQ-binding-like beta-propeller repeat protein, partial [Xanthobacteraceae bacterium]